MLTKQQCKQQQIKTETTKPLTPRKLHTAVYVSHYFTFCFGFSFVFSASTFRLNATHQVFNLVKPYVKPCVSLCTFKPKTFTPVRCVRVGCAWWSEEVLQALLILIPVCRSHFMSYHTCGVHILDCSRY